MFEVPSVQEKFVRSQAKKQKRRRDHESECVTREAAFQFDQTEVAVSNEEVK